MSKFYGFDLDGVVTAGYIPAFNDVIITGRSYDEAAETMVYLQKEGIICAVYFQPTGFGAKTIESSGIWKGEMCKKLGIEVFHEDDPRQAEFIKQISPDTEIRMIGPRGNVVDIK